MRTTGCPELLSKRNLAATCNNLGGDETTMFVARGLAQATVEPSAKTGNRLASKGTAVRKSFRLLTNDDSVST